MRKSSCHPERSEGALFACLILLLALSSSVAARQSGQQPPAPQNPPAVEPQKAQPEQADSERPALKKRSGNILIPAGTRLPLVLHNSVTTRNAKPGDPIYLETLFPIVIESKICVPAGSYVHGEILEAKRPGKVKGRGEILIRMNMLILPNGYTVNFNAIPTGAGTGGNEQVEGEGKIKGDTEKMGDVGTVVRTTTAGTAVGAGIGGLSGNVGRGAGIGTLSGTAAGLMAVLLTRGPELELPRGTTLDVQLDRPLYLDAAQINFTDPGHASVLAGPPNRQPVRSNRFPY
jgi:type IV secretion system protein VirB10